jgi:hypothetical protein
MNFLVHSIGSTLVLKNMDDPEDQTFLQGARLAAYRPSARRLAPARAASNHGLPAAAGGKCVR